MSNGNQLLQLARAPTIPGDSNVDNINVGDRLKMKLNVGQQLNTASSSVTVNGPSVSVTTVGLTTASGASESFTLNNSHLSSLNNTQITLVGYGGEPVTNGVPYVYLDSLSNGSVNVNVVNLGTAALAGAVTVHIMSITG